MVYKQHMVFLSKKIIYDELKTRWNMGVKCINLKINVLSTGNRQVELSGSTRFLIAYFTHACSDIKTQTCLKS